MQLRSYYWGGVRAELWLAIAKRIVGEEEPDEGHALLCTGKAEIIEIRKGGNTLQASW